MYLKTVFLAALAALCAYGFAEPFSPVYDDLNADNQFITIFCHGFDNKVTGDDPNFYEPADGYFSDSFEAGEVENPEGLTPQLRKLRG